MALTAEEFDKLARRLSEDVPGDQSDMLKSCVEDVLEGVRENFEGSHTARGERWPARKDPEPTHPLLIDNGDLMTAAIGASVGADIQPENMTLQLRKGPSGTSRAGIRRHEFGDRAVMGRRGILARPYFGVSEETADAVTDKLADAIVEGIL